VNASNDVLPNGVENLVSMSDVNNGLMLSNDVNDKLIGNRVAEALQGGTRRIGCLLIGQAVESSDAVRPP